MDGIEKTKALVQTIIDLHELNNFELLLSYIAEEEVKAATWFTRKRFTQVCEAIKNEIGHITSLEYIGTLKRQTSYLTLWRASYSKSRDEVLWQIIFDSTSHKIRLLHINWEQT